MNKRAALLKSKYTRVVKNADGWNCYLQIDHQGFRIVDPTNHYRANWFAKNLAIALDRMMANEKTKD